MKLHLTTLLLFLSLSLSSFGRQAMTWIPVYGIGNCKTMMNDATKFHWIKNGIAHIGLQFWVPGDAGAKRPLLRSDQNFKFVELLPV